MRTQEINVYKYEELDENTREKVLNYFREHNDFYFLEEYLTELLKEELKKNKIEVVQDLKVFYSLGYCQGDGFCFIGDFKFKGYNVRIKHNSFYYHKKSTDITLYDDEGNEDFKGYKSLEEEFKTIYYKICDICEKEGYSYIESENSEESIKETIEANEYEFYKDGRIF